MTVREQWLAAARSELNGKAAEEFLLKKWDEFEIKPYYDVSDVKQEPNPITNRVGNSFAGPNGWLNLPLIVSNDNKIANSKALNYLQNGADGIFYLVDRSASPSVLMNDLKQGFCFIGFEADGSAIPFFESLATHSSAHELLGATFWRSEPAWLSIANLFKGYKSFRCLGVTLNSGTVLERIDSALQTVLKITDKLTDYGFPAQQIFNQLAFSVTATTNFFSDVALIRALRILIQRLEQAYGSSGSKSFIRVVTNPIVSETYQPHGELLSNSFAGIAGIMASADALTINSENPNSDLHIRTARNISLLLKEESKLDKVVDPLSGSYFVESLTSQIVETAWVKLTTA
jgi:methylmalonyl-CoA mutase